jgi:type II secretory pathway pseudopilin PulG
MRTIRKTPPSPAQIHGFDLPHFSFNRTFDINYLYRFLLIYRRFVNRSKFQHRNPASGKKPSRRAFTLIETTLTIIIVGLAITALVKLVLTNTQQNAYTQRLTTASLLADNCREMLSGLPFSDPSNGTLTFGPETAETLAAYNDVDDFDGFDSTTRPDIAAGQPVGPVDAARRVITQTVNGVTDVPVEWRNWRQQIAVDPVDPNNLATVYPKPNTARTCIRITVTISYKSPGSTAWDTITQLRWLKTR